MMGFSLEKVASPGKGRAPPLPLQESNRPSKAPKVDDLVVVQEGPRPPAPRRLPHTGDIVVALYKYTDDASPIWEDVKESDLALWQVQVQHDVRDSICFQIQEKFNTFLAQNPDTPDTSAELQKMALIKLVVTSGTDPDAVGTFQRWRPAFYAAGDQTSLHNLMYLLDSFWLFLMKDKAKFETIVLNPHVNVDIDDCWDNFEYPVYTLEERSATLPLHIFEAHPVQGKRIVLVTIQIEAENALSIVFHGGTWGFRGAFEASGVEGYKYENNVYYRVLKDSDIATQEGKDRILNILGDGVLKNVAARVSVDGRPTAGSPAHTFLRSLRDKPNLHFV